ncbi:MAG: TRAP transporter substrate-binding protein, partial [Alphaproteobacteria bacterium]|nr:TRAP transporter substrate-binding protein [Alphaproteobacteria bacterium]
MAAVFDHLGRERLRPANRWHSRVIVTVLRLLRMFTQSVDCGIVQHNKIGQSLKTGRTLMTRFITLCRIAAVGLAISIGMVSVSQAAEIVWRMATKQPAESNEGKAFQRFADKVAEFSNGRVEVKVYPNEQLGKTEAVLEQIQAGTVHLYPEGSAYLAKWVDDVKYSSAPFMFESREHWANFMKSDLFKGWLSEIESKAGVTLLGDPAAYMRGPYRVMVTKKPWSSLSEMQNVKLRMHPNQLAADVWTHLGAEVRTLGWTEVYSSIKQGIVEAVNSP